MLSPYLFNCFAAERWKKLGEQTRSVQRWLCLLSDQKENRRVDDSTSLLRHLKTSLIDHAREVKKVLQPSQALILPAL